MSPWTRREVQAWNALTGSKIPRNYDSDRFIRWGVSIVYPEAFLEDIVTKVAENSPAARSAAVSLLSLFFAIPGTEKLPKGDRETFLIQTWYKLCSYVKELEGFRELL